MLPLSDPHLRRSALAIGAAVLTAFLLFIGVFLYQALFTPTGTGIPGMTQTFSVPVGTPADDVINGLVQKGFIRSAWEFRLAYSLLGDGPIAPGGYELSYGVNVFAVASTFRQPPALIWVTIPEGYRKEQIASVLAGAFGWNANDIQEWLAIDTATPPEYIEGVYYPDTYLMPRGDTPKDAAERLVARFNDVFAPYAAEALAKNIKWTTALTLASLLEREGMLRDFPLIAGILWNRLDDGMRLQVDATVQYAIGNAENGWWPVVKPANLSVDSPYNTYLHKGLPPHPIADPDLAAIKAVLNPATTTCLYYLHEPSGTIHCSATYAGHLANVRKYLK